MNNRKVEGDRFFNLGIYIILYTKNLEIEKSPCCDLFTARGLHNYLVQRNKIDVFIFVFCNIIDNNFIFSVIVPTTLALSEYLKPANMILGLSEFAEMSCILYSKT